MQVDAEPQIEPNLARLSMLDPSMLSAEARKRRFGDLGHLLPISGNSRNVQVSRQLTSLPHHLMTNHVSLRDISILLRVVSVGPSHTCQYRMGLCMSTEGSAGSIGDPTDAERG